VTAAPTSPPLHPACAGLAGLLGTWRGEGHGDYETIEPFDYLEEVVLGHVGKPFLSYQQRTRRAGTGEPLHSEAGYLRAVGDSDVELVVAQPSGIVEIHVGRLDDGVLRLHQHAVLTTPTAKEVSAVTRTFWLEGDELRYEVHMAAVGRPEQLHLEASLRRAE
jgi:hypothetical protein